MRRRSTGSRPTCTSSGATSRNGRILWGGRKPAQHVLVERWVDLNWREGNAGLASAEAVRRFMLEQVGEFAMIPIRDIGPITPVRFKQWDAWRVQGRGQFQHDHVEWLAFYAPEADRTVLLGTRVVVPPVGIDTHALLRDSFALVPGVRAAGVAPEPLARLLPGPELVSPPLGARFEGLGRPVVLQWKPVKPLAPDEYYEVDVDYNRVETNNLVRLTTRATELTLPVGLYETPNCGVFNWQVTLMRQTGTDAAGRPQGQAVSYRSLYWYVRWSYPAGQAPFNVSCPNEQF